MLLAIKTLELELCELVKESAEFAQTGFSVFSLPDFLAKSELQSFPIAGVTYDGAVPKGNEAKSGGSDTGSASLAEVQFTVIIAVQYGYSGQEDTKVDAFSLLDTLRSRIHGYKGASKRPWRFVMERPEPDASTDGLVFYSQVWRTSVPVVGTFNNQ